MIPCKIVSIKKGGGLIKFYHAFRILPAGFIEMYVLGFQPITRPIFKASDAYDEEEMEQEVEKVRLDKQTFAVISTFWSYSEILCRHRVSLEKKVEF